MGTRRLVFLAALLLAGGGAAVATRRGEPVPAARRPVPAVPPIPADPATPPRVPGPPLSAAAGAGPSSGSGAAAPATAESTDLCVEPGPDRVRLIVDVAALGEFFLPVLPAAPDADPGTGEAPAVAPGRPASMDLGAFVDAGGVAAAPVVELVGRRRPELEEGVPVSLAGRVVEADGGAPVAGARLVLTSTFYVRRYFYDHHLREVARAETGADGAWRIERLNLDPAHFGRGGRLYLSVTAPGHAPALAVALSSVSPGVANRVKDVALARASASIRGRVLDQWEGKPVVGGRIYATGSIDPVTYPKDERPALFVGAPTAVTDAEGAFLLEGLGPGLQTLSVHGGDDCVGRVATIVPYPGEVVIRTRAIRGRIEGTVVDGRGDPVPLVTVEGGDNTTHSFADGRFVLENFRGDAPTVTFSHPDYPPVVLPAVADGTAGLVVRMERPRVGVVLEVADRDGGAPVRRVRVLFTFAPGVPLPPATSPDLLASDGRFPVRLPEGATALSVAAEGRAPAEVALAGRADGEVVAVLLAPAPR